MRKKIGCNEKIKMKIISISLPTEIIKIINKIVSSGFIPSRSELIRTMVLQNITRYKSIIDTFQILTDKQLEDTL